MLSALGRVLWRLIVVIVLCAPRANASDSLSLWTISAESDASSLATNDATVSMASRDNRHVLLLETGHDQKWPGVTIRPAGKTWDLSPYGHVSVIVKNDSPTAARIGLRADSVDSNQKRHKLQTVVELAAGQRRRIQLDLLRKMPVELAEKLFGMRGYPGHMARDQGIDPGRVEQITIFVGQPENDHSLEITELVAGGVCETTVWSDEHVGKLFPMIDRFGQYVHKDWPGKIQSADDFAERKRAEAADLVSHPGPAGWDKFGGWADGPQLRAGGVFRVEKYRGKWWLVDPAGHVFWSHGIDCVRPSTAYTPITDRRFYFAELPSSNSPLAQFYGRRNWAPHGYYENKGEYETYNFTGSNLYLKYGSSWQVQYRDLCHRRLRSWGLNTIANWSDAAIYRQNRTPYVVTVSSARKLIAGSTGYWGKFPDPFDPEFASITRRNAIRAREDLKSPWCLGVFVDNELAWGDELSLATAVLASPRGQPAKIEFWKDLKKKYGDIRKLNASWGTTHASWDALLTAQAPPDEARARNDLAAFYTRIAEKYFQVCRDAVRFAAPGKLYLGCRFAWVNDRAVLAAAKYCDVIGFNKYAYSVSDFSLPSGVDKPAIIGEFHFGALDRGMFHTGLRATESQAARAAAYGDYVRGALKNPWLVGTHWFQFGDQATTGRGDGENYQIGFLDVCDTPYPEITAASRDVAASMYALRSQRE